MVMTAVKNSDSAQIVYWHRDLPPVDADVVGEHTIEATSARVPGILAHRDDLWECCHQDLMARTRLRLEQEVARLGGAYAHVLSEVIETRHDDAKGEARLYGRFTYVLYRRIQQLSRGALGIGSSGVLS